MTAQTRVASSLFAIATLCAYLLALQFRWLPGRLAVPSLTSGWCQMTRTQTVGFATRPVYIGRTWETNRLGE